MCVCDPTVPFGCQCYNYHNLCDKYHHRPILRMVSLKTCLLMSILGTMRGGLVIRRRTQEQEVGGSILTQVAVLYP